MTDNTNTSDNQAQKRWWGLAKDTVAIIISIVTVGVALAALVITTTGGIRSDMRAMRAEAQADRQAFLSEMSALRAEARAERQAMRDTSAAERQAIRETSAAERQAIRDAGAADRQAIREANAADRRRFEGHILRLTVEQERLATVVASQPQEQEKLN